MHAPPDFTGKLGIAFCLQFIYHNPFYSPNNDPFIEQPRREVFYDRQDQDLDFAFRRQELSSVPVYKGSKHRRLQCEFK